MSRERERELLKKILATGWLNNTISCEVEELLTQPEQAPSVKLPDSEDKAVMMNLLSDNWLRHHAPHRLNQPEQEEAPVATKLEGHQFTAFHVSEGDFKKLQKLPTGTKIYTAPPKREPLSEKEIREGNQSMLNVTRETFIKGVRFAEVMHGITGVDDDNQ